MAALEAVKRWQFSPARLGDKAVSGIAIVPINFQLS
jgi:outer membrane biosynthesis protein TonB